MPSSFFQYREPPGYPGWIALSIRDCRQMERQTRWTTRFESRCGSCWHEVKLLQNARRTNPTQPMKHCKKPLLGISDKCLTTNGRVTGQQGWKCPRYNKKSIDRVQCLALRSLSEVSLAEYPAGLCWRRVMSANVSCLVSSFGTWHCVLTANHAFAAN